MIIGKKGAAIKNLGIAARASIEALIGKQAYLDLRVKVRDKWRESDTWVRRFGY
jgi:GTP-binding protein Era